MTKPKLPLSTNKQAIYQRNYKRRRAEMKKAGLLPPTTSKKVESISLEEAQQMSNFKIVTNLLPLRAHLTNISDISGELTDRESAEKLLDALKSFEELVKDVRIQIAFACTLFNREKLREMAREGGLDEHLDRGIRTIPIPDAFLAQPGEIEVKDERI